MSQIQAICSLNTLDDFIQEVRTFLGDCRIVLLQGDLASGKTTFVQKFAQNIGIEARVTSPTFSVQNEYENRLFHYDIYQNGTAAFIAQGLLEEIDKEGWHLIEWGDEELERILEGYLIDYARITITKHDKDTRNYTCIH